MGRWQVYACHSPSLLDRRTRCQSFQAIAMKRTAATKRIALPIVRHTDVTHLPGDQPMQDAATNDGAAANSGRNRSIYKISTTMGCAGSRLDQTSRLHGPTKP